MINVATERTNVVTEQNFARVYPEEIRRQYWDLVERSMTEVFGTSPQCAAQRVGDYRELINVAPPAEQILVYHQEPINVAADLAGVETISEEHKIRYMKIYGGSEPNGLGIPGES